jgi:hypothetical protein
MSASSVVTPQRFSKGDTYEEYISQLGDTKQRFAEHEAAFELTPADAQFFQEEVRRVGPVRILAIVEDWCPDVHRGLPIIASIARAVGMDLRVFPRDKNLDIMNLYLRNGQFMSIPVFAFFDQHLNPLCHWIERPAAATRYMEAVAAELSEKELSEEEVRQERRKRSQSTADRWRQETVKELRELLSTVQS